MERYNCLNGLNIFAKKQEACGMYSLKFLRFGYNFFLNSSESM